MTSASCPPPLWRRVTDAVLAVTLAPVCAACDQLLASPLHGPICGTCWSSITYLTPPLCNGCGDPIPSWRTHSVHAGLCPRCRRRPRWVDKGRAVGEYAGALKEIVHALKYGGRRSIAQQLATRMRTVAADLLEDADYVVPVPLHRTKRRTRGFNQAAELTRHLHVPVRDTLRRVRRTSSQTGLSAAQRYRNVRGAFALRTAAQSSIAGARLVLVDDVSTTGATLEACARVLKEAGALEVRAITVARVVGRPPSSRRGQ